MNDEAIPTHELTLAFAAKVICSAIFVSGRTKNEAVAHSTGLFFLPAAMREAIHVSVNWTTRVVEVALDGKALDPAALPRRPNAPHIKGRIDWYRQIDWREEGLRARTRGMIRRRARYFEGRGAMILPAEAEWTVPLPSSCDAEQKQREGQVRGIAGMITAPERLPDVDLEKLKAAASAAFSDPDAHTQAFLVVHRGQLIVEKYAKGCSAGSQLESWSMGKSLIATLLGMLVHQGRIRLNDPAPVQEWRSSGDPRARITIADLLRMSSGLKCSGVEDPIELWERGVPDHFYVYCEAIDVSQFAINRPAEHDPNTVGRYRNCDPLVLGAIIRQTIEEQGGDYSSWPQHMLFCRIGIERQTLETDVAGNFILSGFDYGTARNWARLGLLYLRKGVWDGERILPEGWSEFVSTPAPAWPQPEYGGQFWINGMGEFNLPRDAYFMAGWGGQKVFIIPSHDLVVVRLGHVCGEDAGELCLNEALPLITSAIGGLP